MILNIELAVRTYFLLNVIQFIFDTVTVFGIRKSSTVTDCHCIQCFHFRAALFASEWSAFNRIAFVMMLISWLITTN